LGKARNVEMGFYVRNRFLRNFFNRKIRGLKGCNMSFNKEDLIAVNGFDERYCGPSTGEDTDIGFRLQLNGVRVKNLKNIAILYHRYHRKIERGDAANKPIFDKTKKDKLIFTLYGLKK
jgi:GT2 family glycosyltransferase